MTLYYPIIDFLFTLILNTTFRLKKKLNLQTFMYLFILQIQHCTLKILPKIVEMSSKYISNFHCYNWVDISKQVDFLKYNAIIENEAKVGWYFLQLAIN